MIERPEGRNLDRHELQAVVQAVAGRQQLWSELVRLDPNERTYHQLHLDGHLELWLITWMQGHDTGFHDHDLSAGAVAVAQGQICEERLTLAGIGTGRIFKAGQAFDFHSSDIHRVSHVGWLPAVTLHAYSPPLERMGAYSIDAAGKVQRYAVSHAEELRPLA